MMSVSVQSTIYTIEYNNFDDVPPHSVERD